METILNNEETIKKYKKRAYAVETHKITRAHIEALELGELLALHDGNCMHFIQLERDNNVVDDNKG